MRRLVDDIKNRRNLDVYVTIFTAAVVSILSFFDLIAENKVATLVLAVLAIVAFDTLATRDIVKESHGLPAFVFHDDFAPDLIHNRNNSLDVYLIGVSLSRTIETSFGAFSQTLAKGGRLRILLTDPDASDAALDARCQPTRPSLDEIRREIRSSLGALARLSHASGRTVEVRLTKTALKFGLNYLDVSKVSAVMHVQMYSYRLDGESRPILILRPSDGEWFDCFRVQAETLWADSAEIKIETYLEA